MSYRRRTLSLITNLVFLVTIGGFCKTTHAELIYLLGGAIGGSNLFTYDTDTLATTFVGATGAIETFGGLAYDPVDDLLYMVSGRNNNTGTLSNLYSMNPSTGAATLVGSIGERDVFGLAFDTSNEVLYATARTGTTLNDTNLFSIDKNTGGGTLVGLINGIQLDGLSYDSRADRLVGVGNGLSGAYYSVDRSTAATSLLGSIGFTTDTSGLTYDPNNNLYWGFDYSRRVFTFDPVSGDSTFVGTTPTNSQISGAAFATVPEPTSFAMFMIASACLATQRKRNAKK